MQQSICSSIFSTDRLIKPNFNCPLPDASLGNVWAYILGLASNHRGKIILLIAVTQNFS